MDAELKAWRHRRSRLLALLHGFWLGALTGSSIALHLVGRGW